ncbi:MAG: DNA photolyase [Deltaproteobacteria bacterium]
MSIIEHGKDLQATLQHIYVDADCIELPMTRHILQQARNTPRTILDGPMAPKLAGQHFAQNLTVGKRILHLCRNRGKFLKPCPATREYCCCDYFVLNIGMNCPMDCTYCILQAYMNNPWMSYFVNTDELLAELEEQHRSDPDFFMRIGTGEFTDSMVLDSLSCLSRILVEYIRDKSSMILELKTKSVMIDHLEGLRHDKRTVVAWSLNSRTVNQREELHTPSIDMRLAAAARCSQWGYPLAFHFDPVIAHSGWQKEYVETIDKLFAAVPADKIAWISLGALRFLPPLRQIATQRFPGSSLFSEEFVPGLDGKYRYFRSQRVELYQTLLKRIKQYAAPATCVYLCMESDEIWREVFGYCPGDRGGLKAMLDKTAQLFCR